MPEADNKQTDEVTDEQTNEATENGQVPDDVRRVLTKRDQFEIEKVAGKPLSALYATHDGHVWPTAEYMLASTYVASKKFGFTELDYDEWLDSPSQDLEVQVNEADPT